MPEMYIEALSVCVNYADVLAVTLPHNRGQFDRLLIVTSEADEETRRVCDENGVRCLVTDSFYKHRYLFNKGGGINDGFRELERRDWIVHIDCDMIIPFDLKAALAESSLDTDGLYTMPRHVIKNYKDYLLWKSGRVDLEDYPYSVVTGLGYFQMFHASAKALSGMDPGSWYPEGPRADGVDVEFRFYWKACQTVDRPLIHLGQPELNWMGRKSNPIFDDFLYLTCNASRRDPKVKRIRPSGRREKLALLEQAVKDHFGNVVVLSDDPIPEEQILAYMRSNDLALDETEDTIIVQSNRKTLELFGVATSRDISLLEAVKSGPLLTHGPITGELRHLLIR